MACQDCKHFLPSIEFNKPRWGLADSGYCKAAPDFIQRSKFFLAARPCWLNPPQEKRK